MEDIVLQYTWPRIDAEVSKPETIAQGSLLRAPKDGRVCVTRWIRRGSRNSIPAKGSGAVGQLLREIDEAMAINTRCPQKEPNTFLGRSLS